MTTVFTGLNGVETEIPDVTRKTILDKALQNVNGNREQDYGHPEDNFKTIANSWNTYLNSKRPFDSDSIHINSVDVAAMMALLKLARIASSHAKEDNWIDLAGYAACGGEIEAALN